MFLLGMISKLCCWALRPFVELVADVVVDEDLNSFEGDENDADRLPFIDVATKVGSVEEEAAGKDPLD